MKKYILLASALFMGAFITQAQENRVILILST